MQRAELFIIVIVLKKTKCWNWFKI